MGYIDEIVNKTDEVKKAREVLKRNGYYTDILWSISIVKEHHKGISDEDAYEALDRVFDHIYVHDSIIQMIDEQVNKIKNE